MLRRHPRLQTATALEGIRQDTFALPPMPRGAFQTIIEGPAQRLQGTRRALTLEPALTAELLSDIEKNPGKDALPLLAFTLERLYREYGADGDLRKFSRLPCTVAGSTPRVLDGYGLRSRLPARPTLAPCIRFLSINSHVCSALPSDIASRR